MGHKKKGYKTIGGLRNVDMKKLEKDQLDGKLITNEEVLAMTYEERSLKHTLRQMKEMNRTRA